MKQASDVWAFGCTLVHMLIGEAPWTGRNYNWLHERVRSVQQAASSSTAAAAWRTPMYGP